MSSVVLDASAALAWLLPSQSSAAADTFLAESTERDFVAPFIFDWEVRNILLHTFREAVASDRYEQSLARLESYEVAIEPPLRALELEPLARKEKLSLFDAAYLSLALNRRFDLASRDAVLLAAAERSGVKVWDLR